MNRAVLTLILSILAVTVFSAAAWANCTNWLWQSEGNYWRECVYDDGSRHCFRATDANGSNSEEISCS